MPVRATVPSLLLVVVCSTVALAHGGKTHVMGTVGALDAEHIVVKDRNGQTVSIKLGKDTTYEQGGAPATAGNLKVGDRVVIDVTGPSDSFTATEIQFSPGAVPPH